MKKRDYDNPPQCQTEPKWGCKVPVVSTNSYGYEVSHSNTTLFDLFNTQCNIAYSAYVEWFWDEEVIFGTYFQVRREWSYKQYPWHRTRHYWLHKQVGLHYCWVLPPFRYIGMFSKFTLAKTDPTLGALIFSNSCLLPSGINYLVELKGHSRPAHG